ncbi:MAG TPA: CPBP family glutamic-type intramembrane protease [Bdellovibrionota bacterium]|jgi:membrane protease YdiL (CAAX protease family)|nr:CPBP family glutamic-type intramembrane protease [Bdellovibrionota bacterium]
MLMMYANFSLIGLFVVLRTVLDPWMRSLPVWTAYGVEAAIALFFIYLNFRKIAFRFAVRAAQGWHLLLSVALGALIAYVGTVSGHGVPFDFSRTELWIQLVVVAPLLEEALFRLFLWNGLRPAVRSERQVLVITSLLFSLSHFAAYFYVPPEFRGFVVYQSLYTLGLAFYWGIVRMRTGSWLAPVALHFVLNLSFGLTHVAMSRMGVAAQAPAKLKILIVDMPVGDMSPYQGVKSSAAVYSIVDAEPESQPDQPGPRGDCPATAAKITQYFESQYSDDAPELSESDLAHVEELVVKSHGYHVLGVVQRGLENAEVYTLGMKGPPGAGGIPDPKTYIEQHIVRDFARVQDAVTEIQPAVVLVASSESYEENLRDLKTAGHRDAAAKQAAELIMSEWSRVWGNILLTNPSVEFVVPAGNGGSDGVGDDVETARTIPASLSSGNLIKVASLNDQGCLSPFSNFNPSLVDVAVSGERMESWSACTEGTPIKLSGTSQASAEFVNLLARSLEAGQSKEEFMREQLKPVAGCLSGKVKFGSIGR